MLSGVIFDMDGVLIDSHPAHKLAWRMFLLEIGRECSDKDLEIVLDGRTRRDILRYFLGELADDQIRAYGAIKEKHFAHYADRVRLIPGVSQILAALARAEIPCAVASSASSSRVSDMLDRFKLADSFRTVITGSDVRKGKPDPAIFNLAAQRLAVDPGSIVVFEDAVSGIKGAVAAGLSCIGIGSGKRGQELLHAGASTVRPDFTEMTVSEVNAVVETPLSYPATPFLPRTSPRSHSPSSSAIVIS